MTNSRRDRLGYYVVKRRWLHHPSARRNGDPGVGANHVFATDTDTLRNDRSAMDALHLGSWGDHYGSPLRWRDGKAGQGDEEGTGNRDQGAVGRASRLTFGTKE